MVINMPGKVTAKPTPVQSGPMTAELFGKFVRARRTQQGLRIDDAAMLCGISVETLFKIETAKGGTLFGNILAVADMLGIKICIDPWDNNDG